MAWAITLEISDCAVPAFKIEGARITDNTTLGTGFTDANGQLIYGIADDSILQYIVQISHTGSTVHAANGYINKNFTLNKSGAGMVQAVCLNPAPNPTPGTGGGGTGCFIVSTTTGSSDSIEVNRLRELRDRVTAVSRWGGELVDVIYREYAQFSPAVASELERDPIARQVALWVIVRPLLAWYTLAGVLALDHADPEAIQHATDDVMDACSGFTGEPSILALLDTICAGETLPPDTYPLLAKFAPRFQEATRLRFASWAILDPLGRVWRSAAARLDVVDQVAQWLAAAPLEALGLPTDPQMRDVELAVVAGFFDFQPKARLQLGDRLRAAWPDAANALERTGFTSQTRGNE